MKREEINSLFIPIFDQIYDLVDGQIQSVLDKSDNSDAKIKVLIGASFVDFRPYSWLGASGQMITCLTISDRNLKAK